ncbi:phosphatidylethanolamine-binding protein 1-like isoform X2 [Bemisia tabaci]|uniref:phosphatidylethanolamine-binding protein 1-like isoform X2 n=1 Tax=Bemisia tabaci TaxID=7038 RepID=UPI003B28A184
MDELFDPLRGFILYKHFLVGCFIFVVYHPPFKYAQRLEESAIKDLEQKMKAQHFEEILGKPAEYLIELEWDNGKYVVKAGDKVDIEKVFKKPTKVTWDADLDYYYTLVLYDYDAPLRVHPNLRGFIHWMIGNIPEKSLTAGTTFYDYYGLKLFEEGDYKMTDAVLHQRWVSFGFVSHQEQKFGGDFHSFS